MLITVLYGVPSKLLIGLVCRMSTPVLSHPFSAAISDDTLFSPDLFFLNAKEVTTFPSVFYQLHSVLHLLNFTTLASDRSEFYVGFIRN